MTKNKKLDTNQEFTKKESQKSFADLGLSQSLVSAIEKKGYVNPSPIQAGVIPLLLNGDRDIIGQAQTGTGKTAAFSLPLLERLDPEKTKIQAIVLAPTRELAIQVAKEIESFEFEKNLRVTTIYGGNNIRSEVSAIKKNPAIIVGTPGRIQHHIRTKTLKMNHIEYFVLDEADEMLNFGFRKEIESILDLTPANRKVLLFSATMPKSILELAKKYMGDYDSVKIASKEMTNKNITQKYFCLETKDKFEALSRIMEVESSFYSIIFCRTKREVDALAAKLKLKHLDAEGIHGDIDQRRREKILDRFKTGQTKLLVATDVAARGIDVSELNFVINYAIPESYETYTHRIGRTGRAGNKGIAITFVNKSQLSRLKFFESKLGVTFEKGILPKAEDIIEKKKQHLVEKIEHIIHNEDLSNLVPVAEMLLEESDPKTLVASLLKINHQGEFDLESYGDIESVGSDTKSFSKKSHFKKGKKTSRNFDQRSDSDRKDSKKRSPKRKSRGGKVGGGSARKFASPKAKNKTHGGARKFKGAGFKKK